MSKYDTRTTTFSQEGRLFQVEYALEAINNASTTLGIVTKEGVVIAADRFSSSPLLDNNNIKEKIYIVNNETICAVAGWTADASVLLDQARIASQQHLYRFDENIPIEKLVTTLCDIKQSYTQYGGLRPFGVSFLLGSYDADGEFKLFLTDPAGNFSCWKATAIGMNDVTAQGILKQEWREDLTLEEGLLLAARVLCNVNDSGIKRCEENEFGYVHLHNGKVKVELLSKEKSLELIEKVSPMAKIDLDKI